MKMYFEQLSLSIIFKVNEQLLSMKWTITFCIVSEQFTVKAHPALFEGEGGGGEGKGKGREGGDEPTNEALLFQSTVDINFQIKNAHETQKTAKTRTLCVYS